MKKRALSLLLALVMCLGLMPATVFAAADSVYEISSSSRNQTITSGGANNSVTLTSGWTSVSGASAEVQNIDWSISDSSVATLQKNPFGLDREETGISSVIATAASGLTQDKTVTVTVKITYTDSEGSHTAEDSTSLTVKAAEAKPDTPKLSVSPTTVNLAVGESATVTATLTGVKNYSDYRMSWQFIYSGYGNTVPFTVSGVTKKDTNGISNFDSQGRATITVTGSTSGSATFFPVVQTSTGGQVKYEGADSSTSVKVTVTGGSGGSSTPAGDVYEISSNSRTITSGGANNSVTLTSGWTRSGTSIGIYAKVQSIDWSISDSSVATLQKAPNSSSESYGISAAIVTAKSGLTQDKTVTVTVKITYTYNGASYTAEDSTSLTVKAAEANPDTPKLSVSPTTVNLAVGERATVTATLTGVKNYSDYRMSWQNVYSDSYTTLPFTASGITKSSSWAGTSSFDSQGRATITVTGSRSGSATFFPVVQTSTGGQVKYEGADSSTSVKVTVSNSNPTSQSVTVYFSTGGGSSVPSKTVTVGQAYGDLPTPTRSGYIFDGWYSSSSGGSRVTSSTTVTAATSSTRYIYLYARWTRIEAGKQVTLYLDVNGGSNSVPSQTVTVGQPYGTLPTPTWKDHTFAGWYTSRFGGDKVTSSTTVPSTSGASIRIYAQWTDAGKQVTVSFDAHRSIAITRKTVTVGGTYGDMPTPAMEGYIFDGWFTDSSDGDKVTSSTTVTSPYNHTLYAHWTQSSQVNLEFESLGGSSVPKRTVTVGQPYGDLPTPTREGYTFDGWYTSNYNGSQVTSSTIVSLENAYGNRYITLYARWTEVKKPGTVPSDWAKADVERAIKAGILPNALQNNYQQPITRAEFCQLADFLWYKSIGNFPLISSEPFADTADHHVLNMAAMGVVSGVGNNKFKPNGKLTREQAAAILVRLGDKINDYCYQEHVIPAGQVSFSDNDKISAWAKESVGRIQASGVMQGTGNNKFSPQKSYSREQAVATIMRLYDLLNK